MVMQSLNHPVHTLEQLNKQRQNEIFTDVTIVVSGEKFSAHRSVLAAHSQVFKSVLEDASLNSDCVPNINLDGVDASYFAVLLEFLYTSKLFINSSNVDQVSKTSEFCQVAAAVDLCTKFKEANANPVINYSENDDSGNGENESTNEYEDEVPYGDPAQIKIEVMEEEYPPSTDDLESIVVLSQEINEEKTGGKYNCKRGRKAVGRVSCPVCTKVMTQVRLDAHIRTHTGEKPASCGMCGKSFANIYNLKIHERKHTGEKPYKCTQCNRTFADPSSLSKHKLWHAGVKKKECSVCRRLFSTKSQVTEHMRTHTREKPFSCSDCDKSFSYKCDLKRHAREHTGDLFGPCEFCGRCFNHRGNYNVHLRNHQKNLDQQLILKDKNKAKIDSNSKMFFSTEGQLGNDITVTSQSDVEETIYKARDLADLVSQGHKIEVMISEGKLLVKQPVDQETTAATIALQQSVHHNLINMHSNVINTDKDDSLIIVDQIIDNT